MRLDDKVAIVTGASRGIGRSSSIMLAQMGAKVVVNYNKHQEEADEVVKYIGSFKGVAISLQSDVSKEAEVIGLINRALANFGKIDILVNNAGEIVRPSSWEDIGEEQWARSFDVNLKSAFLCIKYCSKYLMESTDASVVNISSTFGTKIGASGVIAYSAAKSGVVSLTKSFAKALGPRIRVNCISPGIINTKMTASSPKEFVDQQVANTPLRRIGSPQDVANAVYFLSSQLSSFITGHVITVDGGHSLR